MAQRPKQPRVSETQAQIDRFREMAKRLDCDEDETEFHDKLRVIAKQKPKKPPKRTDRLSG